MFYTWLEKGIVFIGHIYDYRINNFIVLIKFKKTLYYIPQIDLLSYTSNQLIACIPTKWKSLLKEKEIHY